VADDDVADRVEKTARHSSGLDYAVRAGLVAYGFVHLLIAYVAVRLITTPTSGSATGQGALSQLAQDTSGRLVLGAMACAFVALTIWQLIAGAVGYRDREGSSRHLMRAGAGCRAVVYGYFAYASAQQALEHTGSGRHAPQSMTAKVLAAPAGVVVLVAVGLVVVVIGVALAVFGVRRGFLPQLDAEARNGGRRVPIVVLGQVGYVVKGLSFAVVGGLLVWAAFSRDPQKSGGLDHELFLLLGHLGGKVAVVVVGTGIGCFGLFLFARARHLAQDSLTS
jgi:hypothetical protein